MNPNGEPRLVARAAAVTIRAYQIAVSPLLGASCRFQPTCSEYARQAVLQYGARRGAAMAARRVARCHPWNEGGFDPLPGDDADSDTRAQDALLP